MQSIGQLLDQLHGYSSQEVELDAKVNLPSLGTRNDSERESTHISKLLPLYVQLSPVPLLHLQRSHLRFLLALLQEYVKKRDYSRALALKRDREPSASAGRAPGRQQYLRVRIKQFMSDVMLLFSDFKEKLTDGYFFENQARLDSRALKMQRDKYLAIYQGLIFSLENLCVKSQISVHKQKDGVIVKVMIAYRFYRLTSR